MAGAHTDTYTNTHTADVAAAAPRQIINNNPRALVFRVRRRPAVRLDSANRRGFCPWNHAWRLLARCSLTKLTRAAPADQSLDGIVNERHGRTALFLRPIDSTGDQRRQQLVAIRSRSIDRDTKRLHANAPRRRRQRRNTLNATISNKLYWHCSTASAHADNVFTCFEINASLLCYYGRALGISHTHARLLGRGRARVHFGDLIY